MNNAVNSTVTAAAQPYRTVTLTSASIINIIDAIPAVQDNKS
tara:strand:+ start:382 stop:507 length:126 start_codon:yes stop_codon:yes gene_type:complete